MELKSKQDTVIELANKLFVYTDQRDWDKLLKEVLMEKVEFDMTSAGGGPAKTMTASEICQMWKAGLEGIDFIHHQSGNFIVNFKNDGTEANIFCYATATHYKAAAQHGKSREFVGSYELRAEFTDLGWRLAAFRFNLKYINGNKDLL